MDSDNKATLSLRVTPGAKHNSVTTLKESVWYIKIAAPPVEGKANEELLAYLSKTLGVRKSALSLLKGQMNRNKVVSVAGLDKGEVALCMSAEMNR